jgi:hypothetical protein
MNLKQLKETSQWLLDHASNVYSQTGEDGIIAKALNVLPQQDKWCVEFGAWDGRVSSNTYRLITEEGYSAVLLEADPRKFQDLKQNFLSKNNVYCLNEKVGWLGSHTLDNLLSKTPITRNFDVLSIDIDGNDYHVWKAFTGYRPKIVVIEYNPRIPNGVDFVQKPLHGVCQGSSLDSLVKLGKSKNYELICVTELNAIFVDTIYFQLFNIPDNSVEVLRRDSKRITHVFFGYDGYTFVRGFGKVPWQGVKLHERAIQVIPTCLQGWHEKPGFWRQKLIKLYSSLKKRGII